MTFETPQQHVEGLVDMFIGERLDNAGNPAGLREAVIDRIARRVDYFEQRGPAQIDSLRSPSSRRIPDAYLVDEETIENELQEAAAGLPPAQTHLSSNVQWPLRCEASRVPRPPTRPSVLSWSLTPIPWLDDDTEWPPAGATMLDDVRQLTGTDGQPPLVAEAPYPGWVQLGMIEHQRTLALSHPRTPARRILIITGLEICDGPPPSGSTPLSSSPPNSWAVAHNQLAPHIDTAYARTILSTTQGPLAALTNYEGQPGAPDRERGIGLHWPTLVPRIEVIALLGLRPETPALRHLLIDDNGPALVGRHWRGFLIHDGSYHPLEPAVEGTDLLLRPDLYTTLEHTVGKDRLALGVTVTHSES
ncbi:hypothetical protein [Nocardia blacklockiae]|uniref:hypothetical protein n=1 Tax=Nocardia blacklockiae TaxID=480036 RepID=UPI001893D05D|nr:hypothetical protein [Nocardia blacklockiae]MBF6176004.1 hypothetical protein [Nocardia blacklockiae]